MHYAKRKGNPSGGIEPPGPETETHFAKIRPDTDRDACSSGIPGLATLYTTQYMKR